MTPSLTNLDTFNRPERTYTGVPLIPKGNGTNTAFIESRSQELLGTRLIPNRDIRTPRTDPLDTHGNGENPNGDMVRPEDKHTKHTRTTKNPKGTTSRTRTGAREHTDPCEDTVRILLPNGKLLDTLAPRHEGRSPLIKHTLPTHPLAQALATTPPLAHRHFCDSQAAPGPPLWSP